MSTKKNLSPTLSKRLCVLAFLALTSVPAQAQFATGGSGRFKSQIFWFDWGDRGATIPAAGTTVTNTFATPSGQALRMTCSISNKVGNMFIKQPGDFVGDGLDDLYNVGGAGAANTMDIGLVSSPGGATITFTFACSATLGAPSDPNPSAYPLSGLVFADAEQSQNAAGQTEYTQGTISSAGTTWRMIDRFRNCTTTDTPLIRTDSAGQSALRMNGAPSLCPSGPIGVAFMEGTTTAEVVLKGGGQSAIALGAMVVFTTDFGDAPASYGNPTHDAQPTWSGGDLAPNSTTQLHSMTLANLVQPTARLGSRVDAELEANHGANADGDDTLGEDDEDGFTAPLGVVVAVPGATYTPPLIACSGGGVVRGWIDFNRDGDFNDPGEVSNNSPVCPGGPNGSGTVALNWAVPANAAQGRSYMRIRTASVAAQIATPTGAAADGEVEDYLITALAPAKVILNKRIVSRIDATDQFTVGVFEGATSIGTATTAGTALTATTGELPVDVTGPYTLRDANAGASALLRYTPTLACVANAGSSGAVPTPTGPTGTGPADWSIAFNTGNDLTCTITNTPNQADLAIAKTNNRTASEHGQASQYAVTVTNNGPGTAIGAVVTDPAQAGLDCPAGNTVTCTGAAGACPATTATVGDLQGTGVTLGTLAVGASLTLQFDCVVQ
ncbi:putative repeat protein (TIGR01451 family) [Lysobacter enzymogenes]|uniref:CshA/CshB family fibrillar adhesin-related protein n=1 Tax=Lysobacter enzymogenes TaxID=69 RepID=UPI003390E255